MKIKEIAEKHLRNWALYDAEQHEVLVRDIDGGVWLGYRTTSSNQFHETTRFDVNVIKDVFFVLEICIDLLHRGKGHGDALYKVLESIAKEIGCSRVQMMPSGWTVTNETRKDYLLRRGYLETGTEIFKDVS